MNCNLCPRKCNIDRDFSKGCCGESNEIKIAKYSLFMFEEPCISGEKGSGAIFFSGCSLKCVFCQNYEISSLDFGKTITPNQLADIFKELENMGAENINLVNPTHFVKGIIEALKVYKPNIPIVYNTHGYENVETLKDLSKYVDIFLPDLKYIDPMLSSKYSNCSDYFEKTSKALLCMRKLKEDKFENGMMKQGLIVRHLILPLCTYDSTKILEWLKENLPQTKVSLMAQYTPYAKASEYPEINRKITKREYEKVVSKYLELNLDGYVQERESSGTVYIPKWDFV